MARIAIEKEHHLSHKKAKEAAEKVAIDLKKRFELDFRWEGDAIAFQRELHVQEEKEARKAIEAQGCEIVALTSAEHDAFAAAIEPLISKARGMFGAALFDLTA